MNYPTELILPDKIAVLPCALSGPAHYAAREWARCLADVGITAIVSSEDIPGAYPIRLRDGTEGLRDGAFRYTVAPEGILLVSGDASGLVYGTYALLEKLGWRFLTSDCEVRPTPPLRLPFGETEERPAFRVREVFWRSAMEGAFAVKLRLNSARSSITPEQGGKAMFYNFSHSFDRLVSPDIYFDSHPEYFSMRDGVRIKKHTQLCLTNPDVLRLCVDGVLRWKREHPEYQYFSVSMNDWRNNCECPACCQVDDEEGSPAGTVLRFVNAVAEAVTAVYPDVRIHTFAYLYCRKPPRLTKPHPAVIIRLCSIECCYSHPIEKCGCESQPITIQDAASHAFQGDASAESSFMKDLRGWSKICRDQLFIWDYTTNYANYLQPFPNLDVLAENLRTFRRFGVAGVLEQGNFSLGRVSALGELKVYLLAKLLWDPDQAVEPMIRDFAAGCWEAGAPAMLRYIRLWQEAVRPYHMSIYDTPDAGYLNEETLSAAETCLNEALSLTTGKAHERLEREALSLRYVRLAQEAPDEPGHGERVDRFAQDVKRLGISELFERRDLKGSFEVLKTSRLTADRSAAAAISYPL